MADARPTIHLKVARTAYRSGWSVLVAEVHDPHVVSWTSLPPFSERAWAQATLETVTLLYRQDGYTVVEGDVEVPSRG